MVFFLSAKLPFVDSKGLSYILAKKYRVAMVLSQEAGVTLGSELTSKEASDGVNFYSKFLTCLNRVMKA